jgi:N-hydroxyarylamine O-acetyltransferase
METTMDDAMITAYLARIGVPRPALLDGAALATLHRAHQEAIPFENLSIHLDEPISLDPGDVLDKIVRRGRGGFCYELNGGLAELLRALGADVRLVSARVHTGEGRFGPPFDHLALIVRTADGGGPWLVDVGFGSNAVHPLRLDDRQEQADPAGVFLLADVEDGDVEVRKDGEPQYRVELRPRALDDFAPTCWYQQTSPRSHFTRSLICSRLTGDGRVTLFGRVLVRTVGGVRSEEPLEGDDAVLAAYREHFGIVLDRVPTLDPVPALS